MQPMAISGKSAAPVSRENKRNLLRPAAHRLPETFHGKQGVCRGLPPPLGGPLPAKEGVDVFGIVERDYFLAQSGHGLWSQPHPVHAWRIMGACYPPPNEARRGRCSRLLNSFSMTLGAQTAEYARALLPASSRRRFRCPSPPRIDVPFTSARVACHWQRQLRGHLPVDLVATSDQSCW